ncbi:MAG: TonB-dependent receptor [Alphaproteobacteria bacterium]|nr:TonB-dependent receptor [Alphaproteobacteria bacterium]
MVCLHLCLGLMPPWGLAWAQDDDDEPPGAVIVVEETSRDRPDPMSDPASVTVIEVNEALPAASDVAGVVDSASGTTVVRLGGLGDYAAVSIRGSTTRQVQVHLDGVPLNPDGAASVNLAELPLWAFQRVEIYRGNAPPQLGASPIGGVVDLRTGDAEGAGVGASVSVGSLRTTRVTALSRAPGQLGAQPTDLLVVAEAFTTQGDYRYFSDNGTEYNLFDDSRPTRANNDKRQLNLHGRWRVGTRRARFSLLEAFLSRDEGIPGHVNSPTTAVDLGTTRSLTSASLEGQRGPLAAEGRAWLYLREERFDDREGEIGVGTQWNEDRFGSLGALGHAAWAPLPQLSPALTASLRQDRYTTTNLLTRETLDAARVRYAGTLSLSADAWLWGERLVLSPVLQGTWLDNRSLGAVPFSEEPIAPDSRKTYRRIDPRGGVLLRPVPLVAVKANAGRYLRPPDFTELFGDRGAVVGNTDLRPERGLQADAGVRVMLPEPWPVAGAVEAGVYWSRVDDLIVMVQNAQRTMVPMNLDAARVRGVELALSLDAFGWVSSQSNLTFNQSEIRTDNAAWDGNQLPRLPRWEAAQRTAVVWGDRLRVGHTWSYTDGNYWDRTNWYRAAPRSIHGVFVRVRPLPRGPDVELDLLNLTDRTVEVVPRNPLDPSDDARVVQPITDFVGYPLPGRTVLLTLRWALETGPTE